MPQQATNTQAQRVTGISGSAKGWFTASLLSDSPRILVITKDKTAAHSLKNDTEFFLPSTFRALLFPSWDVLPFEMLSPQVDISALRLNTLLEIPQAKSFILISDVAALLQRVLPLELLHYISFNVSVNDISQPDDLALKLFRAGYRAVTLVEEVGEYAKRGGVVDFFPPSSVQPLRATFLGNKIESLKVFDIDSQRSITEQNALKVAAVREFPSFDRQAQQIVSLPEAIERIKNRALELETPAREVAKIIDALSHDEMLPGMEQFIATIFPKLPTVFDYLPTDTTIVIDDQIDIDHEIDDFLSLVDQRYSTFCAEHRLIAAKDALFLEQKNFNALIERKNRVYLDRVNILELDDAPAIPARKVRSISNLELSTRLRSQVGSGKALAPLIETIEKWRAEQFKIIFVVGSSQRAERLHKILLEYDLFAEVSDKSPSEWLVGITPFPIAILSGQLTHGFQLVDQKIAFISEREVFSDRSQRKNKASRSVKKFLSSLAQLADGDFIVHIDYGVGRYRGLMQRSIEGVAHDFIGLEYAGSSRLYLPVENIGKIQKYRAEEGKAPKLDKLGSTRWVKAKAKVRESVVTLAGDLIKLYATRKSVSGWRFEPYGSEDERFADGFAFDETPDQLSAIKDTLQDMTTPKPMDRLVCGDAGFGKTEVALRAAFKCIQHARQVALLVPTTILVEQHKLVFKERFLGYPVEVGAVSRFYKPAQNKETLSKLASGEIDIIIGTHKLLQSDVQIKDLGLLIIDEEHRFGVKDKERLKSMRKNVDVLTLTATPIPRTLHMALLGIRDISIISTPPHDRRTIRTYVASYDDSIVRDAILRELQRGGQCFYVHNKVMNIAAITDRLSALVPQAKFAYAHGQMSENELEEVMLNFIEKKIDVLVCTTIVESGLDIPNANTVIVNNAHTFGLAQLYQLRGRVGRSNKQAYAYLLTPEPAKLGLDARKRLSVLQDLDELGLGFNLATKDLEIRGAGNLLGKNQSGHVQSVGIDLYNRILKDAILNLKGEEQDLADIVDPELKLNISAFIPERYIPDVSERLLLYQRLAAILSDAEAYELSEEIEDRFGSAPQEVSALLEIMKFRGLLRRSGIERAETVGTKLLLTFHPKAPVEANKILTLVRSNADTMRFSGNQTITIEMNAFTICDVSELYKITAEIVSTVSSGSLH